VVKDGIDPPCWPRWQNAAYFGREGETETRQARVLARVWCISDAPTLNVKRKICARHALANVLKWRVHPPLLHQLPPLLRRRSRIYQSSASTAQPPRVTPTHSPSPRARARWRCSSQALVCRGAGMLCCGFGPGRTERVVGALLLRHVRAPHAENLKLLLESRRLVVAFGLPAARQSPHVPGPAAWRGARRDASSRLQVQASSFGRCRSRARVWGL
jgi:hypothetical protein